MLLQDPLLLPLLCLLAQPLLLSFPDFLQFCFPLFQLFLLTLDVQTLQALLSLLYGLTAREDTLMLLPGIFEEGSDCQLMLFFFLLLDLN